LLDVLQKDRQPVPYMHVFALLNLLKQICNHPALVKGDLKDYTDWESGKWELFSDILAKTPASGLKVVIYSQYLGMKDSNHEEHENYLQWCSGEYDREKFNTDEVNREQGKYLRWSWDRFRNPKYHEKTAWHDRFSWYFKVMIRRSFILSTLKDALARSRVVVLAGPRQCGKTTLARELLEENSVNYFDLEDPASLARL
jgi:hypothetical protein